MFASVMGNSKVAEVIKDATNVAYKDEYDYCKRVVCSVNQVTSQKAALLDKEVEILSVMCKMSIQGTDYMKNKLVMKELELCGVDPICHGTMRNYRTKLVKKGWLVGRHLNMLMKKAVNNGGISIGIFYVKSPA